MKNLSYVLKVLLILMVSSCEEFCEESTRTAMVIKFYSNETGLETTLSGVSIRGLGAVNAQGNDSTLYLNASLQTALCPLNPGADTTAYIISIGEMTDTLTVFYTTTPSFISSECGCVAFAEINDIQQTTELRIDIVNPSVGQVSYRNNVINAENIRIFY
ncbi:MAG: hypothetical protein LBV39_07165 [Bacteroidales bacterium]|jgi:hypothetical protein|nr:hypothetical protein [Bacteroidales bacterium]